MEKSPPQMTLKELLEEIVLIEKRNTFLGMLLPRMFRDSKYPKIDGLYKKLEEYITDSEEELIRIQEREEQYIVENAESLRRKYGNQYVAVREGIVLGHNKDEIKLAERVIPKFRIFLTIRTIDDVLNPKICEFPSFYAED